MCIIYIYPIDLHIYIYTCCVIYTVYIYTVKHMYVCVLFQFLFHCGLINPRLALCFGCKTLSPPHFSAAVCRR